MVFDQGHSSLKIYIVRKRNFNKAPCVSDAASPDCVSGFVTQEPTLPPGRAGRRI